MGLDLATIVTRLKALPTVAGPPPVDGQPEAAVAAIVRERASGAESEILLIRRAEHPEDPWSGHMAFPGGRRSARDRSLVDTAVRETLEEVGLDLERDATFLTALDRLPAMSRGKRTGMLVTAFVFALRGDPPLVQDGREVAEALWAPIAPLARGEGAGLFSYEHEGTLYDLPCLRIGERVVWGLTFRMLQQLFEAVRA